MSNCPSSKQIDEMWKAMIREYAKNDVILREMVAMADEDDAEAARQASRRKRVNRERETGGDRIYRDYFADEPVFGLDLFRRHFRMSRELFVQIVRALSNHSSYFQLRPKIGKRTTLSPLLKCTAAIRQLAYAIPGDLLDNYIQIGESTVLECLHNFCRCVVEVFGETYLRSPNGEDTQKLLRMHEERYGFPGMLGSVDYMHWGWKNCSIAWKDECTWDDHDDPTILLEAVASADLWIWHSFIGVTGSSNDINVLHGSPLFNNALQRNTPKVHFMVNGTAYDKGYYLVDGIYPEWTSFVKSFPTAEDDKRKKFNERQGVAREDVEHAFRVLQARWAIIRMPTGSHFKEDLTNIILTCIILHNMIIDNEGDAGGNWNDEDASSSTRITMGSDSIAFEKYLQNFMSEKVENLQLRHDLSEHIWQQYIAKQ